MRRLIPIAVSSEKLTPLVRLGRVVYWVATAISVVMILLILVSILSVLFGFSTIVSRSSFWASTFLIPVIAGLVWLAGRAVRYILSGE